ncbi:MAG TPA: hypothetical protein VK138_06650 [Acidiferrobacterales bacterium]|nr:hypothetical protein [Acidiferrobacterales bacterium]
MSRIKAFLIHLGISTIIFLVLLFFIVFIWYPSPYFSADGGWQGIRIVAGVDMVLGPSLTLLVFKSGKPGLKLDLTVIGLLQSAALAWGVWTVHDQRTALVVFSDGGFYSLNSEQIRRAGEYAVAISKTAKSAPGYAFVRLPEDKKLLLKEKMKIFSGAPPLILRGELYESIDKNLSAVLARGLDMEKLVRDREEDTEKLAKFLHAKNGKLEDYAFLPLHCRYDDALLVFERQTGTVIDSLAIDPAPVFYF